MADEFDGKATGNVAVDFYPQLEQAVAARREFLEQSVIPKLKDEFMQFHQGISSVYSFFVAKGYISDDPYKNDVRMNEIEVPDSGPIPDNNKRDHLGRRLSHLDNQFDFLCNFFRLGSDTLTQEVIKQICALVQFVEWTRLTPDSPSVTTAAVAELVAMARKSAPDAASQAKLNEGTGALAKGTEKIAGLLRFCGDFNREHYKFELRARVVQALPPENLSIAAIKTAFDAACPGEPFYKELAEEVVQEDTAPNKDALRANVLKRLAIPEEEKKQQQKPVELKPFLIQGLNAIGSSASTLAEILAKLQENNELMRGRKKSLFKKLAEMLAQMTNKEPEPVVYALTVFDPVKGTSQKTSLNFTIFVKEIEKKTQILSAVTAKGTAAAKVNAMEEPQLVALLRKNMRDILSLHKTLLALDDFFKTAVDKDVRGKVKGIKPELAALKNAHTQANQKMIDYDVAKETDAQYKQLGNH
ncbi:MAG: hypothetical protein LBC77_01255 [Spirochaetaceae bacterium]|nr:hypothetical protein [Spirochaetaceae bacterium]